MTVRLGLVVYPLDGQEIDDLFARAKEAMDYAREADGNRHCFPSTKEAQCCPQAGSVMYNQA